MIFLTGDKHRCFVSVSDFCNKVGTTKDDILVILGDAGINYTGGELDTLLKQQLENLPIRLLCIHGNHEQRPENFESYKEVPFAGGVAYAEEAFPSLLFAKDGEVYDFDGKKALIIGGAYSVDKEYRLARNMGWWEDEQPSDETKAYVEFVVRNLEHTVDYVFSHTCPERYIPKEMFLKGIKQSTVDKSTEIWLGDVEYNLKYERWYCGHWHTNKVVDRMRFLYDNFVELCK